MTNTIEDRLARYGDILDAAIADTRPAVAPRPPRRHTLLAVAAAVVVLAAGTVVWRRVASPGIDARRATITTAAPGIDLGIGALMVVQRVDGKLVIFQTRVVPDTPCNGPCQDITVPPGAQVVDLAPPIGPGGWAHAIVCCQLRSTEVYLPDGNVEKDATRLDYGFDTLAGLNGSSGLITFSSISQGRMLVDAGSLVVAGARDMGMITATSIVVLAKFRGTTSVTVGEYRADRKWHPKDEVPLHGLVGNACGIAPSTPGHALVQIGSLDSVGRCVGDLVQQVDLSSGQADAPIRLPAKIVSLTASAEDRMSAVTTDGRLIVSNDTNYLAWSTIVDRDVEAAVYLRWGPFWLSHGNTGG